MRLLALAAATVLTGSLFAADPELVSLAMPDAQVMAGVNVEQVRLSPLGQYLMAQAGQLSDSGIERLIDITGFDPRRDLREILVSSTGQPGSGSGLILARGAFDVPKIVEAARADGATIETYKGVPIVQKSKNESMAFPDSTLAIAGDAAGVRAAIDRKSAPSAIGSALAVEVNRMSTTEDAWFVTMVPPTHLQQQGAASGAGPVALIRNVQQASGGLKFGANIVLSLQAVSPTDQEASTLAAGLKSLAGAADMFIRDQYMPPAMLLKNLEVTADGPVTKISLSVPEQQIEQMMQAAYANDARRENPPQGTLQPAPAPPPPSAERPTSPRIRVGSNVQQHKLIQQPAPVYPPLAKQARISGVVRLNAILSADGTVQNLTVVSGHPLLVPAAMEAVKQWVYEPTLLNGKPVEVLTQIDVNFELSQ